MDRGMVEFYWPLGAEIKIQSILRSAVPVTGAPDPNLWKLGPLFLPMNINCTPGHCPCFCECKEMLWTAVIDCRFLTCSPTDVLSWNSTYILLYFIMTITLTFVLTHILTFILTDFLMYCCCVCILPCMTLQICRIHKRSSKWGGRKRGTLFISNVVSCDVRCCPLL